MANLWNRLFGPARRPAPPTPPRPRPPVERRWGPARPLPTRTVVPGRTGDPFDLTAALLGVIADVAARCPTLAHVRPAELLVTLTPARTRSVYGLQARVTPMRFKAGAVVTRVRGTDYRVQRYVVGGVEVLYLVTFCVPRFLDLAYTEKLVTIFHELYHIGPQFDGDLRRHGGRYTVHTHSQKEYDAAMGRLVRAYLKTGPDPELLAFLRLTTADWANRRPVRGVVVPRPKMVPEGRG